MWVSSGLAYNPSGLPPLPADGSLPPVPWSGGTTRAGSRPSGPSGTDPTSSGRAAPAGGEPMCAWA